MLLTSLLFVSTMAFADTTPTADDRRECERSRSIRSLQVSPAEKTRLVELCAQERAVSREVSTLESGIKTEEDKHKDCYRVRRGIRNLGFGRGATQKEIDDCKVANDAATAEADRLRGELTTLNTQLETARGQYRAASDTATAKGSDQVEDAFNQLKLSIYDEKFKVADAQSKLTTMARSIDNSVLSLYMRDRMAGLLNSPKMCQVVAACPAASTVTGRDLNSVFNGTMNTSISDASDTPPAPAPAPAVAPLVPISTGQ